MENRDALLQDAIIAYLHDIIKHIELGKIKPLEFETVVFTRQMNETGVVKHIPSGTQEFRLTYIYRDNLD